MSVFHTESHQYDYVHEGPRNTQTWSLRYLLYLEDITAVFDGFKALDIHDLGIGHNELRVVVGPNGAGKTTMCDVISGKTLPASGKVYFDGQDITKDDESAIALMGVGRKFQIPNVFDSLTVYQNMLLALPHRQGLWRNLWQRETAEERDEIHRILQRVRLIDHRQTLARNLSHGQRQWLAISTLILSSPKLLLVDEPAAGLTDAETALTAELLLELRGEHTIICIEHDMEFVRRLASRVTVLNEGRILAEGSLAEIQANEQVIEAYLGR
jgi:urea transport system ATP-binding protein